MTSVGSILPFDSLLFLATDETIAEWLFCEFSGFFEDLTRFF